MKSSSITTYTRCTIELSSVIIIMVEIRLYFDETETSPQSITAFRLRLLHRNRWASFSSHILWRIYWSSAQHMGRVWIPTSSRTSINDNISSGVMQAVSRAPAVEARARIASNLELAGITQFDARHRRTDHAPITPRRARPIGLFANWHVPLQPYTGVLVLKGLRPWI